MEPFGVVVAAQQRQLVTAVADPGDDRGEDLAELGADDQEPFPVGLRRGDLQQRDRLAGGGQGVGDEAAVGELGEFFDADPGVAEDFDDRPPPEDAVFFEAEVAACAVEGVGPHHTGSAVAAVGRVGGRDDPHEASRR